MKSYSHAFSDRVQKRKKFMRGSSVANFRLRMDHRGFRSADMMPAIQINDAMKPASTSVG